MDHLKRLAGALRKLARHRVRKGRGRCHRESAFDSDLDTNHLERKCQDRAIESNSTDLAARYEGRLEARWLKDRTVSAFRQSHESTVRSPDQKFHDISIRLTVLRQSGGVSRPVQPIGWAAPVNGQGFIRLWSSVEERM